MNELIVSAKKKIDKVEELFDEIRELQQNRSNFALEKFVVGQHDKPARQRKQVLDELLVLLDGLNQCVVDYEMTQIDIEELQEKVSDKFERRRNEIKLREKQRAIKFIELRIIGLVRECNFLLAMLERMPKYTREQFEKEEAEYWESRLSRQAWLTDRFGGNFGNVDAILQLYSSPGMPKPSLPVNTSDYIKMITKNERKKLNE